MIRTNKLQVAKRWIDNADSVLIVAGAGMSVKKGEMVYVNTDDFAKHYPFFLKWGYRTGYEGMGLMFDPSVPDTAKWGYWAHHLRNSRYVFEPNDGYETLLNMLKDKDYFVMTSNTDGCFERSGFDKDRIYTAQGDFNYFQCFPNPCRPDAVFEAGPTLEKLHKNVDKDGNVPESMIPKCKYCGGKVFGNVRFGGGFCHYVYEEQNDVFRKWLMEKMDSKAGNVAILEIGAGFNTPIVTRIPAESFARDLGSRGHFIRINPSDPKVPSDINALSFSEGWQVLNEIQDTKLPDDYQVDDDTLNSLKSGSSVHARRYPRLAWDEMWKHLKDRY